MVDRSWGVTCCLLLAYLRRHHWYEWQGQGTALKAGQTQYRQRRRLQVDSGSILNCSMCCCS